MTASHNTGKRSAVRSESGQPVYPSGPGLGVGPTSPDTAGRKPEACPPLLASQPQTGREPEGRALGGREAPVLSSLDSIQNNRNKLAQRNRHCGAWTIKGNVPGEAHTRFHRLDCRCWHCSYCGPRKAKRYKAAIRATAEAHHLNRFLTLTLDPSKIEGDPVRYLRDTFNKFRTYLQRRFGRCPQYIAILEFQKNGNPHLHILIDRYVEHAWISQAWQAIGGGRMVDIRYVDAHRVSHYLAKYLTKELLLSAPKRSRRVTTSRGIHLIEKQPSQCKWELVKTSVFFLIKLHRESVLVYEVDEELVLSGFAVSAGHT